MLGDRLVKQAEQNLLKFGKNKCKILYQGRNNPVQLYRLGADRPGSSSSGKDQGSQ